MGGNEMSDRPTPETDALDCELHTPRVLQDRYSEMRDHAQKLEQERDEARELLASEKITRNHIIKRSVEVEKERDEAREALDCLLAVIGLTPIAGNKKALQEAVDQGLVVLRKLEETK
jgi:hypothetical protein